MSKELHQLAQGCPGITKGTNTFFYLSHAEILSIPKDRTVTYGRIVIDHRPQKVDPNCVRIAVGRNLIKYPFELTTCTADMLLSKIMWNSIISTPDAQFAGANIKNVYLKTPLDRYEYMRMPLDLFPDDIVNHYNLRRKAKNNLSTWKYKKECTDSPKLGS